MWLGNENGSPLPFLLSAVTPREHVRIIENADALSMTTCARLDCVVSRIVIHAQNSEIVKYALLQADGTWIFSENPGEYDRIKEHILDLVMKQIKKISILDAGTERNTYSARRMINSIRDIHNITKDSVLG